VPCPRGGIAYSPEQAAYRARELGGERWVVKAQIHSGGARRGRRRAHLLRREGDREAAADMLGRRLVTRQTGPRGKLVNRIYVEEATDIAQELYFALVLDRASERVMVVASSEGGMEIEEIARTSPTRSCASRSTPPWACSLPGARNGLRLGLDSKLVTRPRPHGAPTLLPRHRRDMVEINPLVVTGDGRSVALDAR
jgi:malate-CoA ligase subunit beta